ILPYIISKIYSRNLIYSIVDVKNKKSLGVFKVINNSQHIITNPVDAPEIEAIYKDSFDIAR
ncbi:hypothetical protein, partial [Blautia argi]|uniref:hypothetical protein n=1 Tax=Blautia argi TaxID=1912897 RepID=UPI002943B622